jgi:hypothetical protein
MSNPAKRSLVAKFFHRTIKDGFKIKLRQKTKKSKNLQAISSVPFISSKGKRISESYSHSSFKIKTTKNSFRKVNSSEPDPTPMKSHLLIL